MFRFLQTITRKSAFLLLWAVLVTPAKAAPLFDTLPIFETSFSRSNPIFRIIAKPVEQTEHGLLVKAGGRIRCDVPPEYANDNFTFNLGFFPPNRALEGRTLLRSSAECYCAIKIGFGPYEIELSDRWVRLQRYDSTFAAIDTVLTESRIDARLLETESVLSISLVDDICSVRLNTNRLMVHRGRIERFYNVNIAAYAYPFDLQHCSMDALRRQSLEIDTALHQVRIAARFHPDRYTTNDGFKGHHLVVYEYGKAALEALFTTAVSDDAVDKALRSLGSKPIRSLSRSSFTDMNTAGAPAPRVHARGTGVTIVFVYADSSYSLEQFCSGRKKTNLVHTDNSEFRREFQSGDIVAMHSSPGTVVANSTLTMADLAVGRTIPVMVDSMPFREGGEVTIVLQLKHD